MRDDKYLKERLANIWSRYFSDVPHKSEIEIRFGRSAVKRLGSIREVYGKPNITQITINKFFQEATIPDFLIDATIAHELCHYAHGFASPLPKLSPYPHRGGIVDKELAKRGLGWLVEMEKSWLSKNWLGFVSGKELPKGRKK